MLKAIKDLKGLFYEIKNKGWIKSDTNNLGSIGHTFEKLLCIQTNELEFPGFEGIEIKIKSKYSSSHTTLFCCTPTGPHFHEVERLKDFETFINLIEIGIIRISLKIGVFRTGNKIGQIHDHGTSFCIEEENLEKLYDLI